jgi:hypothetical protein
VRKAIAANHIRIQRARRRRRSARADDIAADGNAVRGGLGVLPHGSIGFERSDHKVQSALVMVMMMMMMMMMCGGRAPEISFVRMRRERIMIRVSKRFWCQQSGGYR